MKTIFALLCACLLGLACSFNNEGRHYYFDAEHGDDSNSGKEPQSAFQSLEKASDIDLQPGDRLLFRGGQTFPGTIELDSLDSGTKSKPILIASYGKGRASIDAKNEAGIMLDRTKSVLIKNLFVKGSGRNDGNISSGIFLNSTEDVEIDFVEVFGFQKSGIYMQSVNTVRLSNIHAHDNGYAGIASGSKNRLQNWNHDIYIGKCLVENNAGDPSNLDSHSGSGVVLSSIRNVTVEYCEARDNGWDMPRDGEGPSGIWAFLADSVTIQHSISHDNQTSTDGFDGSGFELDGGVTNSVIQYNLAYNNEGAGYRLSQFEGASDWTNNIVRYNISINDGSKNANAGINLGSASSVDSTMSSAEIYNNTIINQDTHALKFQSDIAGINLYNNIFLSADTLISGRHSMARFENNLYWTEPPFKWISNQRRFFQSWARLTGQEMKDGEFLGNFENPKVSFPIEELGGELSPTKLRTLMTGRLIEDSPAFGRGRIVDNNGGRDFWGNPVKQDQAPDVGAFQFVELPAEEVSKAESK